MEELAAVHDSGFAMSLHSDIVVPYIHAFGTDEQKRRFLPGCASGEIVTAIAMTEPGTGSDLASIQTSARRDGDDYVLNGQKTFISNGILCDLCVVAARTGGPDNRWTRLDAEGEKQQRDLIAQTRTALTQIDPAKLGPAARIDRAILEDQLDDWTLASAGSSWGEFPSLCTMGGSDFPSSILPCFVCLARKYLPWHKFAPADACARRRPGLLTGCPTGSR